MYREVGGMGLLLVLSLTVCVSLMMVVGCGDSTSLCPREGTGLIPVTTATSESQKRKYGGKLSSSPDFENFLTPLMGRNQTQKHNHQRALQLISFFKLII